MTKIPRDDGLLSEPTTDVNGNDPQCKRVIFNQYFTNSNSVHSIKTTPLISSVSSCQLLPVTFASLDILVLMENEAIKEITVVISGLTRRQIPRVSLNPSSLTQFWFLQQSTLGYLAGVSSFSWIIHETFWVIISVFLWQIWTISITSTPSFLIFFLLVDIRSPAAAISLTILSFFQGYF